MRQSSRLSDDLASTLTLEPLRIQLKFDFDAISVWVIFLILFRRSANLNNLNIFK